MDMDDLYQAFKIQCELDDMRWVSECKCHITHLESKYQNNMVNKDFKTADIIREVIDLIKIDIKRTEHGLLTEYGGSEVSKTQPSGNKTVFILKR